MTADIPQVIIFPPHYEDINTLSFSTSMRYELAVDDEQIISHIQASTTFLNASGALLYMYSYAGEGDLEWTRTSSADWAREILQKTPPPPAKSPNGGVNWDSDSISEISGTIFGGIIVAIAALY